MATKSMEGYKTARLAQLGDEEAQQKIMAETPGFNMLNTQQTYSQPSKPIEQISKDREVEIGLGKSVGPDMSDEEKKAYVDSLTDAQYRQMNTYKNQGYSFEAARTLLENSDGLANPTAQGKAKYNPKGNWFTNIIGGAYDSATGIPRFIANNAADIIGWTAKQLGADEEKTDALVQNYKDYLDSDWSGKSIGANTDSMTYKVSKGVGDLAQTFAYGALGGNALQGTKLGQVANTVKNSGLAGKMAVGAAEGATDMGIYSVVSDSELPSAGDLALGATLGAAFPLAGAAYKGAKGVVKSTTKNMANEGSEFIISKMAKLTPKQEEKFFEKFGESYTKFMHDRNLYTKDDLIRYYKNNIATKDAALATMKGRYKNDTLTKVVDTLVDYAKETEAPNLEWLIDIQKKNAEGGLEHIEIEKIKRLFESHKERFNYDSSVSSKIKDKYTNRDTALRKWQQEITKESGLSNIAEINNETQAAYLLKKNLSDITKTSKNGLTFGDFALSVLKGDGKEALWYLVGKKIASSPTFRKKSIQLLDRMSGHTKIEDLLMDYEEIAKINSEKEFAELLEKRGVGDTTPRLGYDEAAINDAGKNVLVGGEQTIKTTPSGQSFREGQITELYN